MSAVSTAQRFRNRTPQESAVLLDAFAGIQSNNERTLTDSIIVSDDTVARHQIQLPGERIESLTDLDTSFDTDQFSLLDALDITDSITVVKSTRVTLSDFVQPLDEGFITDKDLIRQRVLLDIFDIVPADNFVKTVTRAEGVVNTRVASDSINVLDFTTKIVSGIVARTLSDSISVFEFENLEELKTYVESLDVSESHIQLRLRYRVMSDSIVFSEDLIVTRNAKLNSASTSDSFSIVDQVFATFVSGRGKSAKIKHGIELV